MVDKKSNGHTATLDQRIAACIASDVVDKSKLTKLVEDAVAAIAEAEETIKTESAAALDISNADPDAFDLAVRKAERTIARLDQALPKLRDRLREIDAREYAEQWHAAMNEAKGQRDPLADELAESYPSFVQKLIDLYRRIDENTALIDALHARAPIGEHRRLADAEQMARDLPSYDGVHPRLRDNLRLPDWDVSRDIAFPVIVDWNARAALMSAAFASRLADKFALTHSADWGAARDLQIKEQEAETAKRDEELKQAEAESLAEYQRHQRESELRRRGLTPEDAST